MATIQDMIKKLQRFGDEIQDLSHKTFTILPDANGMLDRQCPNCKVLFMVDDEDWNKLENGIFCPSCGERHERSDFLTDAHYEEGKEGLRKSLFDNWEDNMPIPNNVINLQSTLDVGGQVECPHCKSKFASSESIKYCPCCGDRQ